MTDKNVRYKVSMPTWYHKRLKLWAYLEGTDRAGLTTNIVKDRIRANWEGVNAHLDELAQTEGVTRQELEKTILGDDYIEES
jgi:hypothetical protein